MSSLSWVVVIASSLLVVLSFVSIWRTERALRRRAASQHSGVQVSPSELAEAAKLVTEERLRADRYFKMVEAMEKERDEWRALYQKSSAEFGNAQEMLESMLAYCEKGLVAAEKVLTANKIAVPAEVRFPKQINLSQAFRKRRAEEAAQMKKSFPDKTTKDVE